MTEQGNDVSEATVLIVEDDPTLLSTLAYNLRREGYRVLRASDGESGLAIARREIDRLDLILLDLMLPGMNGFEVLRSLRTVSDVPVLILSARGEEQDKIDGLELGADDYVEKPFALRELLARVRAAVRRRSIPAVRPPTVLYRGAIEVEPDRRVARANGVNLQLRPKEFGLLSTFAMEPGRVFSRQELLDRIWGEEIVVDERTVDVHVSWLRAKLVDAGVSGDVIKTIYGSGYRFVSPVNTPSLHDGDGSTMERVAL
jgi:DNA-binding response OmpR family regulator